MRGFLEDDGGHDLAEYCLIAALIALLALGLLIRSSGGISGIWSAADSLAGRHASGTPSSAAASNPAGGH